MSTARYERLNNIVMATIYSPLLLITAYIETKQAHVVKLNRRNHEEDDNTTQEWEVMQADLDFESEGWTKRVEATKPNVETDAAVLEVQELKEQVLELKKLMEGWKDKANGGT